MARRFHDEAEMESDEANEYYSEQSLEVGFAFVAALEEAVTLCEEWPLAAPIWPGRPDVRRRVLVDFPYSIIYAPEPSGIFVVAVAHAKRRPGYWVGRLRR